MLEQHDVYEDGDERDHERADEIPTVRHTPPLLLTVVVYAVVVFAPPAVQQVAAQIAQMDVPVVCEHVDTVGLFVWGLNRIRLDYSVCRGLAELRQGKVSADAARAVLVLTHEAMHAPTRSDYTDERVTECRALHGVAATARMLGATAKDASRLARLAIPYDRWVRHWYRNPPCP